MTKLISRAIALLASAGLMLGSPALAGPDKPLVLESGQMKQLPAGTTLQLQAPTTGAATINLPHGIAPTSPTNGDCWTTTSSLACRINGSTATVSGTNSGDETSSTILSKLSGASGGGTTNFLRADGTWAVPAGGGGGGATSGTWTPTLSFGTGTTGITYSTQLGYYVRVGKLVTIWFDMNVSSTGSSTGNAFVGGLPFNVSTALNQVGTAMWGSTSNALNSRAWFGTASGAANAKQFGLRAGTNTFTALTNTSLNSSFELSTTLSYITDDA